jgi:isocitrate/isopropylmalate dehydrogenase
MLDHLGEHTASARITAGLENVYRTKEKLTRDVGGSSGTSKFADSVIEAMEAETNNRGSQHESD